MATQAKLSHIAINKILLATDFSPEAQNALQCAAALARHHESKLFVAHVIPPEVVSAAWDSWGAYPPVMDATRRSAQANMAQLEQGEEVRCLQHELIMRSGEAWEVISQVAGDQNVDLIVMGAHGRSGLGMLIMGSIAEKVIRHAACPVLTIGPEVRSLPLHRVGHILYATDFAPGSMAALTFALSLAEEDRAELTMLHIIETKPESEAELIKWKQQDREAMSRMVPADEDFAYKPEIEVEVGDPAEQILLLAETRNAELIAMGSHSGALATHSPWTTLHHVLQNAHCPVLTVRAA